MKFILLEDVKKVGKNGSIVEVSDGYGTNFLIPRKLAVLATKTSLEIKKTQDDNKAKEEQLKKERKKNLLVGSIFITWFMISLSIFSIAADLQNAYLVVMNFGQYMLIFGGLAYNSSKEKIVLIAPIVGLGCIVIPLLMMIGPKKINWDVTIPAIALLGFIIAGLIILLPPIINRIKRKKNAH